MSSLTGFIIVASTILVQAEAALAALPQEVVEELRAFEGQWTATGDVNGKALKGRWAGRLAPGGHCVSFDYRLTLDGEPIQGKGVMGWDAANKELVTLVFFSNGVHELIRGKLISPGQREGTYTGSAEGKPFEAKCSMRRNGPNEWTFNTKGLTLGGEKQQELSVRFVRTEKKPKAAK